MIKRRLYKQDHGDKDDVSDSSSSSSSSDSGSEADPEEKAQEVDIETVAEEKYEQPCSPSPGSGYESGDSSGNEVTCDPSGLLMNDEEEGTRNTRQNLNYHQLTGKDNVETAETQSNILAKNASTPDDFAECILKCRSVFKCRLCPRIVCLTEETLKAHLESKRHARSEKLLSEGRLKTMLNSDGEIEEDLETHAERHARTIALAQDLTNTKRKNKGRQRQKLRLKRKKMGDGTDKGTTKQTMKNPAKKKRRNED